MPGCQYQAGRAVERYAFEWHWMKKTVWEVQKLLVLHSLQSQPCSPQVETAVPLLCLFSILSDSQRTSPASASTPSHEWSFQNCFLYLGNGPIAMPSMLLLIYRGHSMKQPSGNVLIINLFHTLIKDSWQPLVFAAAVQQESDAGELHLREKRLPGI